MSIARLRQPRLVARAAWAASIALATASQAADWPFYRKDLAGTANAGEPLTLNQGGALEISRQILLGGSIFSNPVVANGNLYYTAGDGYLHAVSMADPARFTEKWKKPMYASGLLHLIGSGCSPTVGREPPVGAPAVVGTTVFAPGGDGVVYSFDASGNQNWASKIADVNNLGEFLWSSIFPLNGRLYIGIASLADCLLVPGRLIALDQATGAVVGTWWGETGVTNHMPGAGIWTQPAYDAVSKRIFVTTGTLAEGKTTAQQPWADAFVAIDPDTMTTVDYFSPVPNDSYYAEFDFGGSPTLYDSPDGLRH
jgi:outer membrane protein assembly factor BamB